MATRPPHFESLESRRLLAAVMPAFADQIGLTSQLNLQPTFSDDFNGTTLDPAKWQIREGPRWRPTPTSDAFAWTHRDSIRVNNGVVELIAYNDPATGQYRSGWIQTGDNFAPDAVPAGTPDSKLVPGRSADFEQRYGYWEARLKFDSLPGEWAAFWVHSYRMVEVMNDPSRANRPDLYGTEYDVVEHGAVRNGGYAADEASAVVHANGYESFHTVSATHTRTATKGPNYSPPSDWHVYGLLWTPNSVSYYLDGNRVLHLTDPKLISKVPHVGILSTEIGAPNSLERGTGNNYFGVPQPFGSRETSQAKLSADYVRVWQLAGVLPPTNPTPDPTPNPAPAPTPQTSVAGSVFVDLNGNGRRDAGEVGRAGVGVYLDLNMNARQDAGEPAAVTDGAGNYRFTGIRTGMTPARLLLGGTSLTQTFPDSSDGGAWVNVVGGRQNNMPAFGVKTGGATPSNPAPTNPTPTNPTPSHPTPALPSIAGSVTADTNANGRRDAGETGAAGVRVYLDYNMNGRRDAGEPTTLTAASGAYRFDDVRIAHAMAIRLELGSGVTQTAPRGTQSGSDALWVATVAGQTYADRNFHINGPSGAGHVGVGTASGVVWADWNRNNKRDPGEGPMAGAIVWLDLNMNGVRDANEPTQITAADGSYRFTNVPAAHAMVFRLDTRNTWYQQTANTGGLWRALEAGGNLTGLNFGVIGK